MESYTVCFRHVQTVHIVSPRTLSYTHDNLLRTETTRKENRTRKLFFIYCLNQQTIAKQLSLSDYLTLPTPLSFLVLFFSLPSPQSITRGYTVELLPASFHSVSIVNCNKCVDSRCLFHPESICHLVQISMRNSDNHSVAWSNKSSLGAHGPSYRGFIFS